MKVLIMADDTRWYIKNESLCKLLGKTTLNIRDMKLLQEIGVEFEVVRKPIIVDGVAI